MSMISRWLSSLQARRGVYLGIGVLLCTLWVAGGMMLFRLFPSQGLTFEMGDFHFHVVSVAFEPLFPIAGYESVELESTDEVLSALRRAIETGSISIESNESWTPADAPWTLNCSRASEGEYTVSINGPFNASYIQYITQMYPSAENGVVLDNANEERVAFLIDASQVGPDDFDRLRSVLKNSDREK